MFVILSAKRSNKCNERSFSARLLVRAKNWSERYNTRGLSSPKQSFRANLPLAAAQGYLIMSIQPCCFFWASKLTGNDNKKRNMIYVEDSEANNSIYLLLPKKATITNIYMDWSWRAIAHMVNGCQKGPRGIISPHWLLSFMRCRRCGHIPKYTNLQRHAGITSPYDPRHSLFRFRAQTLSSTSKSRCHGEKRKMRS